MDFSKWSVAQHHIAFCEPIYALADYSADKHIARPGRPSFARVWEYLDFRIIRAAFRAVAFYAR